MCQRTAELFMDDFLQNELHESSFMKVVLSIVKLNLMYNLQKVLPEATC